MEDGREQEVGWRNRLCEGASGSGGWGRVEGGG